MKNSPLPLLLALVLVTAPALGAETAWTEVAPGARLRAISSGSEQGGRALIGLEIALDPGLKTYWRVPGETGVPTSLAIADASGPRLSEVLWPLPRWDTQEGFADLVYDGELVLPTLVSAPVGASLTLEVTMGICSDICVPVHARLDLPGATGPDAVNRLRLTQALAETPIAWDGADAPLFDIAFDRQGGVLALTYDAGRIDPRRVFPSLDGAPYAFSIPQIDGAASRLSFRVLARPDDEKWRGLPARLTFATADGPYEIVLGS